MDCRVDKLMYKLCEIFGWYVILLFQWRVHLSEGSCLLIGNYYYFKAGSYVSAIRFAACTMNWTHRKQRTWRRQWSLWGGQLYTSKKYSREEIWRYVWSKDTFCTQTLFALFVLTDFHFQTVNHGDSFVSVTKIVMSSFGDGRLCQKTFFSSLCLHTRSLNGFFRFLSFVAYLRQGAREQVLYGGAWRHQKPAFVNDSAIERKGCRPEIEKRLVEREPQKQSWAGDNRRSDSISSVE